MVFQCAHCRKQFKTERGMHQHQKRDSVCSNVKALQAIKAGQTAKKPNLRGKEGKRGGEQATRKQSSLAAFDGDSAKLHAQFEKQTHCLRQFEAQNTQTNNANAQVDIMDAELYDQNFPVFEVDSDTDDEENYVQFGSESDSDEGSESDGEEAEIDLPVNNQELLKFRHYVRQAQIHHGPLRRQEVQAIKLLDILRKKRATLDTYDDVMDWHLREIGTISDNEGLIDAKKEFIGRQALMDKLAKRHNKDPKELVPITKLILPSSKAKVKLVLHQAKTLVVSLLTDPRLSDEDFLFFGDDPLAPPPNEITQLGDINTGTSYVETYHTLITKPGKQILVPIIWYTDGSVAGQFEKMEITGVKMTLGIFNRQARDKPFAWRTIGYVPNFGKAQSRGNNIFKASGHLAAHTLNVSDGEGEDQESDDEDAHQAQDYHSILAKLLESYRELEGESMLWDLSYGGKVYKEVELVFYTAFIKCDTKEADKLCGRYGTKSRGVAQICRYCTCPTAESDDHLANYPYKTEAKIQKMVDRGDPDELKNNSQHPIQNAFHGIRFGLQNKRGIHGACPLELLHAVLLGTFMRIRDCFIAQIGHKSISADEINALSKLYGKLFTRQSDRDLPKTNFANGINKGKIMAKEFSGALLVMAAILQSAKGRQMLSDARSKNFRYKWLISDWSLTVETLLCWEAFLKLDVMDAQLVKRLATKHKHLMYLIKKVGNRTKGMGWKLVKFHAILHMAEDMEMFGVPMNVDTGSNESGHKPDKYAAKLTQKNVDTFEEQTEKRRQEFDILDLAIEEIKGRPLWDYFRGYKHAEPYENHPNGRKKSSTGGSRIEGSHIEVEIGDDGKPTWGFTDKSQVKNKAKVLWDDDLIHFLIDIQKEFQQHIGKLPIATEHKRNGQIFRGHPNYRRGGVWNDWVIVDWGVGHGQLPCEIWCFVDLTELPAGVSVKVDGVQIRNGVYGVVESSAFLSEEQQVKDGGVKNSDLFTAIQKEVFVDDDGEFENRSFYLADVEAFVEPVVVVPDVGSVDSGRYFMVTPRQEWANIFAEWLKASHKKDKEDQEPWDEE